MKYDDCKITESVSFPNQNITRAKAARSEEHTSELQSQR